MKVELRPLAEIKPYEKNPRVNDKAVDAVARSITITEAASGAVLMHCHAGCSIEEVSEAIGLAVGDLFPTGQAGVARSGAAPTPRPPRTYTTVDDAIAAAARFVAGKPVARWAYHDQDGTVAFWVVRIESSAGKTYRPVSLEGNRWRLTGLAGPLPLYRLPSLATPGVIYHTEGEKAADELVRIGLNATTSAHGASSARRTDWTPLCGREVVSLPDNDAPGKRYVADSVALMVRLQPPVSVKVVCLPDLPLSGDVVDFIETQRANGNSNELIREMIEELAMKAKPVETDSKPKASASPEEWEPPIPFGRFDLPVFPLEAFPVRLRSVREFCAAVAVSFQVPPDLPAVLVLAVAGAALAKRICVHVQGDWWEPVNLYVAVAMPPGERKSAVFRRVNAPLEAFERAENERLAPIIAKRRAERQFIEASLKYVQGKAVRNTKPEERAELRQQVESLTKQLAEAAVHAAPRYIADDATPEALASLLSEQGGRIALLSPEGDTFDLMAGRYGKDRSPNLGVYLKGHAGDELRVDRVGRASEYVTHPAITVGLAIQPDVLRGLMEKPGFRGRGLLGRFIYSLPKSLVGYRALDSAAVPESVKRAYAETITAALNLSAVESQAGEPRPQIAGVSDGAGQELDRFRGTVEEALRESGMLHSIRDWGTKLPGAVCRIAGIFHGLIHAPSGDVERHTIDTETMVCAIAIGEYAIAHACAAFHAMAANPSIALAHRIVAWIEEERPVTFTKRDAFNRLRGAIQKVTETEGPLSLLIDHLYIRDASVARSGPGRRPSQQYEVNPISLAHITQNAHKSDAEPNSAHCAHSALRDPE